MVIIASCKIAYNGFLFNRNGVIMYQIKANVITPLSRKAFSALLRETYDENDVDVDFSCQKSINPGALTITFERNDQDDGELILNRIQNGEEINDKSLSAAAGQQLLEELQLFDIDDNLEPLIDALENGDFTVSGIELLRPVVAVREQVISEAVWKEKFNPVINHIDQNASMAGLNPSAPDAGCMFETYGADFDYIRDVCAGKILGLSTLNVWSWRDGDDISEESAKGKKLIDAGYYFEDGAWVTDDSETLDETVIESGFNVAGRPFGSVIGYIVTQEPAEQDVKYVVLSDDMSHILLNLPDAQEEDDAAPAPGM
jgi:hypothetical protein